MKLEAITARLPELINEHRIPGLQLGVIYNSEVILCDSYGYRNIEKQVKADTDTVYAIGSVSKSFTASALAALADEGRLRWEDRVKKHMPEFEMYDAYVTQNLTIRDICSHNCGLPRHDMSWYGQDISLHGLVAGLKYLRPNKTFRAKMQYQNHMFALASCLIEAVTGKPWSEYIKDKLLKPLNMNNTYFSVKELQQLENKALPYIDSGSSIKPLPYKNVDNIAGAGAMNSSIKDLLIWIRLQLSEGLYGAVRVISGSNLKECHSPQIIIKNMFPWKTEEMYMQAYGLGWFVEIYRGHKVIYHSGTIDGFTSLVSFIPEIKSGFVILINKNSALLSPILQYMLYDLLFDLEPLDWDRRIPETWDRLKQKYKSDNTAYKDLAVKNTKPSYELPVYEGIYFNEGYGQISIVVDNGLLKLTYGALQCELQHLCFDSFCIDIEEEMLFTPIQFVMNPKGDVSGFKIKLEPDLDEYMLFRRERRL